MTPLAQYLLAAILSWSPPREHAPRAGVVGESEDDYRARVASIAEDIADVVESEPPVVDGDHSRTAVLLAALAFWESRFALYVDLGLCTDRGWRATPTGRRTMLGGGDCDGGWAASLWQIHAEGGIVLEDGGGWHHEYGAITGAEIAGDRRLAARVALHMVRQAYAGGLRGYTGESGDAPKAKARLDFARRWWSVHPFAGGGGP